MAETTEMSLKKGLLSTGGCCWSSVWDDREPQSKRQNRPIKAVCYGGSTAASRLRDLGNKHRQASGVLESSVACPPWEHLCVFCSGPHRSSDGPYRPQAHQGIRDPSDGAHLDIPEEGAGTRQGMPNSSGACQAPPTSVSSEAQLRIIQLY